MPDFKKLFQKFTAFLLRNWQWKLLSLFLAVCLWSGLITQDDSLTREKTFTDVAINITNADTLRRNGFIIVEGLDNLPTARIHVDVPQKNYNTVTASNYNLRVDLSRIREAGEQTLQVLSSSSSNYGTVTSVSVDSVPVRVDEYITRSRIPVRLNMTGQLPEGFYAGEAQVDPVYVVVSGPKSLVENVVRCVADYDLSAISAQFGTERTAVPFRLIDGNGNDIASDRNVGSAMTINRYRMNFRQRGRALSTSQISFTDVSTCPRVETIVHIRSANPIQPSFVKSTLSIRSNISFENWRTFRARSLDASAL